MLFHRFLFRSLAFAGILVGSAAVAEAQARPHVISGRVTTDSGAAIANAEVLVTLVPTPQTIGGRSDQAGNYHVVIPTPTGSDYLLYVTAPGRRAFRQRVTITAPDTAVVVNVALASDVVSVPTVRVRAQRKLPPRELGGAEAPGANGMSKVADGVANGLPPELQGNLEAMALLIPGLSVTSAGPSAFGLSPESNAVQLNGMTFGGDALPRDMRTTTNFLLSPWDPSRGGFSGVLSSTNVGQGSTIMTRAARLTVDAPFLQSGDPVAARFGQNFTSLLASDTRVGEVRPGGALYNHSIDFVRRVAPVSSLLDLDTDALARAGISADSASRLLQLLRTAGVPLDAGGPRDRTTTAVRFLERFDYSRRRPNDPLPQPAYTVLVGGQYAKSAAASLSPTVLPASTGTATNGGGFIQALSSRYFGGANKYVNETAANISFSTNRGSPSLALPSGSVLIASSLNGPNASAAPAIGTLGFGGNSALARDQRSLSFEINNQTSAYVDPAATLKTKLYVQSRYQTFEQSISANRLGSFTYASLGDVAANRPSAFSRTLNVTDRSGGQWTGAASLGADWTTADLVITGGVRAEANAFRGLPAANPAVTSAFGVTNRVAPRFVDFSPRVGFTLGDRRNPGSITPMATLFRSAGVQVRGGIGKFTGVLPPVLLADAMGATGLPSSSARLLCVGPAAPAANWAAFASNPANIPSSCTDGATTFADTAPSVSLVSSAFRPTTAWRGTLGSSVMIAGTYFSVDGAYSLNRNQPSVVDLNFAGTPRFALAGEGGRPVFVSPSSIVPSTGSVSAVESRLSPAFGRVGERRSDLRGESRQITVYAIPTPVSLRWTRFGAVALGYTHADTRVQARGFDQSTGTDPRAIEWAASPYAPRHQVTVQTAFSWPGIVSVTLAGRAMSGVRYTPTVAGDVNGDGFGGDRAFIFDPAAADPAVAGGLRALMSNGSTSARQCLAAQINSLAGRLSCVGPWTATANASILIPRVARTNGRVQATINIANPLGLVDQLLHGTDNLRGWGSSPLIDGTLYQVRGFDPARRAFTYQVNPRFGVTNPSATTFRTPFRLSLDVRVTYGPSVNEQWLDLNLRSDPAIVASRATPVAIRNRLANQYITDMYGTIMSRADSLGLTRDQVDQMGVRRQALARRADTVFRALATEFAALPPNYDREAALRRVTETANLVWDWIYAEGPFLRELLTPQQQEHLPAAIREMLRTPKFRHFFYSQNGLRLTCIHGSRNCP